MKNESNIEISKIHYLYKQQPTYMLEKWASDWAYYVLRNIF